MNTPIADFVRSYADSGVARFHMPGHKGRGGLGCEPLDITEIDGADVLSAAAGIIAESEANTSRLFGSGASFFSCEGSSLCIKAMLALIKRRSAGRCRILAARNVHKSFVYACALLDIDVVWLFFDEDECATPSLCSCRVSPKAVSDALLRHKDISAVYLTSPDYLGVMADIRAISAVCDEYSLPLLVDNAHGAYLAFLEDDMHPISLGATMCCDSAHKTLPVLTGGAYLHISKERRIFSDEEIRDALSLFASTSPSYLILQSLDLCNAYLAGEYRRDLSRLLCRLSSVRCRLESINFPAARHTEPLKIVLESKQIACNTRFLASALCERGVVCEFYDDDYLVLMLSPSLEEQELDRLISALSDIEKPEYTASATPKMPCGAVRAMSIRDAIFAPHEYVDVKDALGRVCASPSVSCPPAVPIVVSGEVIGKDHIDLFRHYGISCISVVK